MKTLAALIFLLLTTGCMSVGISRAERAAAGAKTEDFDVNSFLWGFLPAHLPPETQVCPQSRIETIHLGQNGSDVFITAITLGIFVPQRAEVSCSVAANSS